MSAEPVKYFTQSWRMLNKGDKKWVGHIIILTLLQSIPLIGFIALLGYGYTWSNRTAWGMDTSPTDRTIDVGKIMMTGLITGAVIVVWSIVVGFLYVILSMFTSWIPFIGVILLFLVLIPFIGITVLSYVAAQRAAIYNHVWPGLQIDKVWDMFSRDWIGLLKIILVYCGLSVVLIIFSFILIFPIVFLAIGPIVLSATAIDGDGGVGAFILAILSIGPAAVFCIAAILLIEFGSVVINLLSINAIGIWMRQLKPETWGSYNDPIPQQGQSSQTNYIYEPVSTQQHQSDQEKNTYTQPSQPEKSNVEPGIRHYQAPEKINNCLVGPPSEANTKTQDELAKQSDLSIVESQKQATEVDDNKNNLEEDSK